MSLVKSLVKGAGRVLCAKTDDSISDAAKSMSENKVGSLLVTDDRGKTAGILTERDIISKVIGKSMSPDETRVFEVMTRKVVACTLGTTITRAQQVMAEHGIRHMPIIDDGKPVGMISTRDILNHQLATVQTIAQKQSELLNNLEQNHPGISRLSRDESGRIVI